MDICVHTKRRATHESETAELRTALRAAGWPAGRVQAHGEQCELAQSMQYERVSRGQTVWQAGEVPTAFYLVLEGSMQLLKPVRVCRTHCCLPVDLPTAPPSHAPLRERSRRSLRACEPPRLLRVY